MAAQLRLVPGEVVQEGGAEGVGVGEVGGAHFLSETAAVEPAEGSVGEHDGSPAAEITINASYTIHGDGRLDVTMEVDATKALPAPLPVALYRCVAGWGGMC